ADLKGQACGHAIVAIIQDGNDLVGSRHHTSNFEPSLIVDPAAKISWISNSAAEGASAGCALHRKKQDLGVLGRLACDSVDDLPLHSQCPHSSNCEIDAAEDHAGLKVDRSG